MTAERWLRAHSRAVLATVRATKCTFAGDGLGAARARKWAVAWLLLTKEMPRGRFGQKLELVK